jgi:uracil-DNA glycosylase family 4
MPDAMAFDPECRRCPRLASHLDEVRRCYPEYHARPVAPFGSSRPSLLIVGLAPGMHGANATGRPFTGDHAGILLYKSLFVCGFSNRPEARSRNDGLVLNECRITNAVKCLPPKNKPTATEIKTCNRYLKTELAMLRPGAVILALGAIAHTAVVRALGLRRKHYPFGHGSCYALGDAGWLLDAYHCSRYNTQTGRLTEEEFLQVLWHARALLRRSKLST